MLAFSRSCMRCFDSFQHSIAATPAYPAPLQDRRSIDDYRPGYPRFTALLSAYNPWLICRRFDKLRARILLLKQDKLSLLEQQLEQIDREEPRPLFLGKSRWDQNTDRLSTLLEIETALADYDHFIKRTQRVLSFPSAEGRDVASVQNWVSGTGCMAREETAYLSQQDELVSLAPVVDSAVLRFETWVEDKLIRHFEAFRGAHSRHPSTNPNVYIHQGQLIQRIARVLLLVMITLLLMLPVIICNLVGATSVRIVIVMLSTVSYLLTLSWLTNSKTIELILAGATYATVLIVFVSGTATLGSAVASTQAHQHGASA
ncbi:hypothetical protein F4780DRAFT_125743 [Xylariomycetidae sp. FL0641]|nr:hypothetical protein F4780DRAFT_125743 [Xylariomycetidae sp. FL0641]